MSKKKKQHHKKAKVTKARRTATNLAAQSAPGVDSGVAAEAITNTNDALETLDVGDEEGLELATGEFSPLDEEGVELATGEFPPLDEEGVELATGEFPPLDEEAHNSGVESVESKPTEAEELPEAEKPTVESIDEKDEIEPAEPVVAEEPTTSVVEEPATPVVAEPPAAAVEEAAKPVAESMEMAAAPPAPKITPITAIPAVVAREAETTDANVKADDEVTPIRSTRDLLLSSKLRNSALVPPEARQPQEIEGEQREPLTAKDETPTKTSLGDDEGWKPVSFGSATSSLKRGEPRAKSPSDRLEEKPNSEKRDLGTETFTGMAYKDSFSKPSDSFSSPSNEFASPASALDSTSASTTSSNQGKAAEVPTWDMVVASWADGEPGDTTSSALKDAPKSLNAQSGTKERTTEEKLARTADLLRSIKEKSAPQAVGTQSSQTSPQVESRKVSSEKPSDSSSSITDSLAGASFFGAARVDSFPALHGAPPPLPHTVKSPEPTRTEPTSGKPELAAPEVFGGETAFTPPPEVPAQQPPSATRTSRFKNTLARLEALNAELLNQKAGITESSTQLPTSFSPPSSAPSVPTVTAAPPPVMPAPSAPETPSTAVTAPAQAAPAQDDPAQDEPAQALPSLEQPSIAPAQASPAPAIPTSEPSFRAEFAPPDPTPAAASWAPPTPPEASLSESPVKPVEFDDDLPQPDDGVVPAEPDIVEQPRPEIKTPFTNLLNARQKAAEETNAEVSTVKEPESKEQALPPTFISPRVYEPTQTAEPPLSAKPAERGAATSVDTPAFLDKRNVGAKAKTDGAEEQSTKPDFKSAKPGPTGTETRELSALPPSEPPLAPPVTPMGDVTAAAAESFAPPPPSSATPPAPEPVADSALSSTPKPTLGHVVDPLTGLVDVAPPAFNRTNMRSSALARQQQQPTADSTRPTPAPSEPVSPPPASPPRQSEDYDLETETILPQPRQELLEKISKLASDLQNFSNDEPLSSPRQASPAPTQSAQAPPKPQPQTRPVAETPAARSQPTEAPSKQKQASEPPKAAKQPAAKSTNGPSAGSPAAAPSSPAEKDWKPVQPESPRDDKSQKKGIDIHKAIDKLKSLKKETPPNLVQSDVDKQYSFAKELASLASNAEASWGNSDQDQQVARRRLKRKSQGAGAETYLIISIVCACLALAADKFLAPLDRAMVQDTGQHVYDAAYAMFPTSLVPNFMANLAKADGVASAPASATKKPSDKKPKPLGSKNSWTASPINWVIVPVQAYLATLLQPFTIVTKSKNALMPTLILVSLLYGSVIISAIVAFLRLKKQSPSAYYDVLVAVFGVALLVVVMSIFPFAIIWFSSLLGTMVFKDVVTFRFFSAVAYILCILVLAKRAFYPSVAKQKAPRR